MASYQFSIITIALQRTVSELWAWDRRTDGLTNSSFSQCSPLWWLDEAYTTSRLKAAAIMSLKHIESLQ